MSDKHVLIDHVLNTPRPAVGEVWISRDKRDDGRSVTIVSVDDEKVRAISSTTARTTKISIDTLVSRFRRKE